MVLTYEPKYEDPNPRKKTPEKETPTPKTVDDLWNEMRDLLASWAITDPETTLILGNFKRMLTAQKQAADELLREVCKGMLNCYSPDDTVHDYQDKMKEIAAKHGITNL